VTGLGNSGHGFKISTKNCAGASKLIRIDNGADYITISHVEFAHCGTGNSTRQDSFYCVSNADGGSSNITLSHCYMHDVSRVFILMNHVTNSMVENCYFDERRQTDPAVHGGGAVFNYCGLNANNTIRYNIFKNVGGTGAIEIKDSIQSHFYIYGNVFYHTASVYAYGNGAICNTGRDTNKNMYVYNNTFVDCNGAAGIFWDNGSSNIAYNNLWYNCKSLSFSGTTHDYNLFYNSSAQPETNGQIETGSHPFVDYAKRDFRLARPTDASKSLPSPFNRDMNGNIRGSDGVWDRGAYEFVSGTGNLRPDPPQNLKITVIP
jgi:hypothetical protein